MNYRHAYHAGNFADVVKHAVLALVIEHMKLKPGAFRVIDTHAGLGAYDLSASEAQKTGEWREGIGRLLALRPPAAVADLLAPYLTVVAGMNAGHPAGVAVRYPGSPRLARALLRPGDVLVVNELHPEDCAALRDEFHHDAQVKVMSIDGWQALKAMLPPKERRGVMLVDPPFEEPGELGRLTRAAGEAMRRFAGGTLLLWYPIKDPRPITAFKRELTALGIPKMMALEVMLQAPDDPERLNGSGLVVVNPPYTLQGNLRVMMPFLCDVLKRGAGATWRLETLSS